MNNKLIGLKLVLAVLLLISSLSCGSQEMQTRENSANGLVNNGSSNSLVTNENFNTNVSANKTVAKTEFKDPKEGCSWLPELKVDREWKKISSGYYCASRKTEKAGGGKLLGFEYKVFGEEAGGAQRIELLLAGDASVADTEKAEKRFVEIAERLWQKAFGKPLPKEFKEEMLKHKGKPVGSRKQFTEPVTGEIVNLEDEGDGTYGMYFRFDFYKA